MSDSLIEQVRKLAALQEEIPEGTHLEGAMYGNVDAALFVQQVSALDCKALLAHMHDQQAVVEAAREYRQVERDIRIGSAGMLNAKLAMHALDAALNATPKRSENDGK